MRFCLKGKVNEQKDKKADAEKAIFNEDMLFAAKAEDLFLHNIKSDLPQMQQVNCFSTTNEIYAALRKNYVDAIAGHEAMLGSLVKEGKNAYRMLDESIYKSELGVAFKKGTHEEVAADLTETLKKLQREGITEKIVTKYGLDADEILLEGEQNE